MSERQLSLNLFIYPNGHHEAAWRHPQSVPESSMDIGYYQQLALRAEREKLDAELAALVAQIADLSAILADAAKYDASCASSGAAQTSARLAVASLFMVSSVVLRWTRNRPGTSAPPDCGRLGPAQLTVASSLRLPPLLSVQVTPTLSPALSWPRSISAWWLVA